MREIPNFQIKIIRPPAIIPASAPLRLDLRQKRASSMVGPKAAPKPAHAKETTRKTELLGFQARIMATAATPTTVARAAIICPAAVSLTRMKSCRKSSDTLEAAARSWESAVDMVAARIPARITPATIAKRKPFWLMRSAIFMMIVSDSEELELSMGISPARDML